MIIQTTFTDPKELQKLIENEGDLTLKGIKIEVKNDFIKSKLKDLENTFCYNISLDTVEDIEKIDYVFP